METKFISEMYTEEGELVRVIEKTQHGYLGVGVNCYEDDDENNIVVNSDYIQYFSILYEQAPTNKIDARITELRKKEAELEENVARLKEMKRNEDSLLNKVSKYPAIQEMIDYLSDDFTHKVFVGNLEVCKRSTAYNAKTLRLEKNQNEWFLQVAPSDSYSSSDYKRIKIFNSAEDTFSFCKGKLMEIIKRDSWKTGYSPMANFKSWFDGIHHSCEAKQDIEVVSAYTAVMNELQTLTVQRKEKELKDELEKKQKELEAIQNSISK